MLIIPVSEAMNKVFASARFFRSSGIGILIFRLANALSIRQWPASSVCLTQKRLKSKGQSKPHNIALPKSQIPPDLLDFIKDEEMSHQFAAILTRFQTALHRHLMLRPTPQILAELPISDGNVTLGQVANIVLQRQTSAGFGSETVLIDLASRPDLIVSARKAVIALLDSTEGGSGGSQLQTAGSSAFTVKLRTIITGEARERLIQKGREMLNQVRRDMDRVYQAHDKLIHASTDAKKRFSEDNLFLAREYLRAFVKQQHALASDMWDQRHKELKGD